MKEIKVTLSPDGIARAVKEIDDWSRSLQRRIETFTQRLAEEGYSIANVILSGANEGVEPGSVSVSIDNVSGHIVYTAGYYLTGDQAVFVEFGAGVYHNGPVGSSLHPKGEQMGMTIGQYRPGSLGRFEAWRKPNGEVTHGTPTYMPIYSSSQELAQKILEIANEVFNG